MYSQWTQAGVCVLSLLAATPPSPGPSLSRMPHFVWSALGKVACENLRQAFHVGLPLKFLQKPPLSLSSLSPSTASTQPQWVLRSCTCRVLYVGHYTGLDLFLVSLSLNIFFLWFWNKLKMTDFKAQPCLHCMKSGTVLTIIQQHFTAGCEQFAKCKTIQSKQIGKWQKCVVRRN